MKGKFIIYFLNVHYCGWLIHFYFLIFFIWPCHFLLKRHNSKWHLRHSDLPQSNQQTMGWNPPSFFSFLIKICHYFHSIALHNTHFQTVVMSETMALVSQWHDGLTLLSIDVTRLSMNDSLNFKHRAIVCSLYPISSTNHFFFFFTILYQIVPFCKIEHRLITQVIFYDWN